MERKIIFNKENNVAEIQLDAENPFLKINSIEFPTVPKKSAYVHRLIPQYTIKVDVQNTSGGGHTTQIQGIPHSATEAEYAKVKFTLNKILTSEVNDDLVRLEFINDSEKDDDVILYYTILNQKVNFDNPFDTFNNHLSQSDNVKILFSGPFGQGKTTFLNYFFTEHQNRFEVFKLYPVNYAVSPNEDIFRYIKAELLFQLMGKDIEFQNEKFSYTESAKAFFKSNPHKVLAPFLRFLPGIGKDASEIYEKFYALATTYLDFHDDKQKDDKKKALKFIENLYDQEGSIYEDNYYTQIIRQLLLLHKKKHKRQNVLIIDDLDRMDPDHIFRIFNVFGAHFDSPERFEGLTNKFGFDKIILVCDYANIQAIFAHRYGNATSLHGYLNKYFSKNPYYFDNAKAIEAVTNDIISFEGQHINTAFGKVLTFVLNDLIYAGELSLRDLLKLTRFNFYGLLDNLSKKHSHKLENSLSHYIYFPVIAFLTTIYDSDTIISKLKRAKAKVPLRDKRNYSYLTTLGFPALLTGQKHSGSKQIIFKTETYSFKMNTETDNTLRLEYYVPIDIDSNITGSNYHFTEQDLIEILILNAQKLATIIETDN